MTIVVGEFHMSPPARLQKLVKRTLSYANKRDIPCGADAILVWDGELPNQSINQARTSIPPGSVLAILHTACTGSGLESHLCFLAASQMVERFMRMEILKLKEHLVGMQSPASCG